ncbi:unnamed protein product [Closterium sp. Yama58-4]|nr:unnamed protein product [Closterium sp. Yama58-4]
MAAAAAFSNSCCHGVCEAATVGAPYRLITMQHSAVSAVDGNGGIKHSDNSVSLSLTSLITTDETDGRVLNTTTCGDDSRSSHVSGTTSQDMFEATSLSSVSSDASQGGAFNNASQLEGTFRCIREGAGQVPHHELRVDSFDLAELRGDENREHCVSRSPRRELGGLAQPVPSAHCLLAEASPRENSCLDRRETSAASPSDEDLEPSTGRIPFNSTSAQEQLPECFAPLEADSMSCIWNPGETGWESVRRALEEKAAERLKGGRSLEHHANGAAEVLQRRMSNCGAAELLERIQTEEEEVTDEQDGDGYDDGDGGTRCEAAGGADLFAWPVAGGSARWWSGWAGSARLDAVPESSRDSPRSAEAASRNASMPRTDAAAPLRDAVTQSNLPAPRDDSSPHREPSTPRGGCSVGCGGGGGGGGARVRPPRWQMDASQLVIRNFVARGSFGTVHRGQYNGRDVAVKLLNWEGESVHGGARAAAAAGKFIGARNGCSGNAGGAAGCAAEAEAIAAVPAGKFGCGEKEGAGKAVGKPEAAGKINSADLKFLRDVFAQEVLVWSKLRHKNICEFVGAIIGGQESYDLTSTVEDHQGQLRVGSNLCCLVLEFLPGGTLKQLLAKQSKKKKRLPLKRALHLALQVAEGLRYLHARNIVHRDLKTDNLLLDQKHRVVKIADFGVSRVQPGDHSMKRRTGTFGYMAPEVLKEQPYDHKADVYSYGIVLWEIVTCGNPFLFEGLKPEQVCCMVNQGLRPDIPSSCPPALADLMRDCWHHTPARRPNMGEVVERLRVLTLQCAPAIPTCACM